MTKLTVTSKGSFTDPDRAPRGPMPGPGRTSASGDGYLAEHAIDVGTWELDLLSGRFRVSPRWKSLLGLGPADEPTLADDWLSRVQPEDRRHLELELTTHI